MDGCIDTQRDELVLFALGANSEYWKADVEAIDKSKEASISHYRLYRLE